ncbi:hypothetical protein [Streptomyces phaeochromogenes]
MTHTETELALAEILAVGELMLECNGEADRVLESAETFLVSYGAVTRPTSRWPWLVRAGRLCDEDR